MKAVYPTPHDRPPDHLGRGCAGKWRYATHATAVRAMLGIRKRATAFKSASGDMQPNAYHCPCCGGFHWGHLPRYK